MKVRVEQGTKRTRQELKADWLLGWQRKTDLLCISLHDTERLLWVQMYSAVNSNSCRCWFFFLNKIVSLKILYYSSCTSHVHRPLVCGSQEKKIWILTTSCCLKSSLAPQWADLRSLLGSVPKEILAVSFSSHKKKTFLRHHPKGQPLAQRKIKDGLIRFLYFFVWWQGSVGKSFVLYAKEKHNWALHSVCGGLWREGNGK